MKRNISVILAVVLACLTLLGCGGKQTVSKYHIEYLNKEKTRIVEMPYEPDNTSVDGMIKEFLAMLSSDPDTVECKKTIPNDVEVTDWSLDGALLSIYFDSDYNNMDTVEEVLCRAAVVRTMTQIDGVDCVTFYVDDEPLKDARGTIIGSMNQESFIENPGEQINSIQNTTLTLYFANEEGDGLVKEVREEPFVSIVQHLIRW